MRKTKHWLVTASLLLCSVTADAAGYFKLGDIWYNITSETNLTAEVVYNPNGYSGAIEIPETMVFLGKTYRVTSIGTSAFNGDTNLTSVTIPTSVTSIGGSAFKDCTGLASISIPESVTSIGADAFSGCSGMKTINFPSKCSAGLYAFQGCTGELTVSRNLPLVQINTNPKTYGYFYGSKFSSVIVDDNVTSVGNFAFWNCSTIVSVSIPESVTSIGANAFYGCSNLTEITLHSNPTIGTSAIPTTTKVSLVLDDSKAVDLNISNANTFDEVIYNRELGAGHYGTIMLPFAPDAESLENFAFYTLKSVDGETLTFDEVVSPVVNTPYLYTLREGKSATQITGGETTISPTIVVPEAGGWQTIGSFTNQTVDCSAGDACYYAINSADNMLYNVVSKMHVKPYRAYFKGNATNAAQLRIRTRDGGETLIDAAEVEDLIPAVYYDLSGRRVENPAEGIYIVNGKKVVL